MFKLVYTFKQYCLLCYAGCVQVATGDQKKLSKSQQAVNNRVGRLCTIVASTVTFCWTPTQLYTVLYYFNLFTLDTTGAYFAMLLLLLPVINSGVNPLIYGLMWKPYRQAIRQVRNKFYRNSHCAILGRNLLLHILGVLLTLNNATTACMLHQRVMFHQLIKRRLHQHRPNAVLLVYRIKSIWSINTAINQHAITLTVLPLITLRAKYCSMLPSHTTFTNRTRFLVTSLKIYEFT